MMSPEFRPFVRRYEYSIYYRVDTDGSRKSSSGINNDRNITSGHGDTVLLDGFRGFFGAGNQGARVGVQYANIPPGQRARHVLGEFFVLPGHRRLDDGICRSGGSKPLILRDRF